MFKVHNSNNFFEFVSLYLRNIVFFAFELNMWFRITTIIIEGNPNSKIYGNTFGRK